jgi:two-component system NtrC family response regulator
MSENPANETPAVLIVDDDAGTCETLSDVLRRHGYAVTSAASGRAALEAVSASPPRTAIVDIKLPDISGLELLRALRAIESCTEVVFITGHASLASAIQAINSGAFAYLTKPFEMEHLLATLAKAV